MNPPSPAHVGIIQTGEADGKSSARLFWPAAAGMLIVAAGLKAGLLLSGAFPFNADEAIVGLMARHILQGMWPTFFYGQAYMGSLDASLVAGAFAMFGPRVDSIRLVQLALYLGTVFTTIVVARKILGPKPALFAGLLMAIPTVNLTLYTSVSLGGYGEALLIGNMLMLATLALVDDPARHWIYLAWGFLSGIGLWAFGLTLVYVLPGALVIGVYSLSSQQGGAKAGLTNKLGLAGLGGIIGASPWIFYALAHGTGALLAELGGSAIAGASPGGLVPAVASHALNLLVFGTTVIMGLRPPWDVVWLVPILIPVVVAFWLGTALHALRMLRQAGPHRPGVLLLAGVAACVCGGFILTPFGADPSGRYFTPLAVPMAVFGAGMLEAVGRRAGLVASLALAMCVVGFNLWGTIDSARRNPPGLTTQFNPNTRIDHTYDAALIEFLARHGEMRGYTNYWVAYPLAFLSSETVLFVPRLPYRPDLGYTPRDDRYAPYDDSVSQGEQTAFITTGPGTLDAALEAYFSQMTVEYKKTEIGDYHVYYALTKRVPAPNPDIFRGGQP